ncbi:type VI secretion system-associated protein TagF [Caldimonas sp.]|uniref:type VI secretion system-associated protein TagF n=1 Tax=Caldimonas sp. TaxID=2838790 RepID=UPI00307F0CE1
MSLPTATAKLVCFGKLPSCGDFVRNGTASASLVQTLDRWMSRTLELLAQDPCWKQTYDQAPATHFAFLGPRSPVGLAGYLVPSQDASGRRYPFIVAASFGVAEPVGFLGLSPLALSRLWTQMEHTAQLAQACQESTQTQEVLTHAERRLQCPATQDATHFREFLETQTLGSLESLLEEAGQALPLRQTLLALGLLLRPLIGHPNPKLERGLQLPLPSDPLYRPFVASFWLDLVAGFLRRSGLELGIFTARHHGRAALVIGFNGACPRSLRSVLDPQAGLKDNIEFSSPSWVEPSVETDYGLKKLSSYLRNPTLSLAQASQTFRETFLGL